MPSQALRETLASVSAAMVGARDGWWIISGAAVALHLDDAGDPSDVDVMLSVGDARRLLPRLGLTPAPGPASPLFRSALFCRWEAPPLSVEFMAGFQVAAGGGWRDVAFLTRERVELGGATVFVPSVGELRAMLDAFGRPKDRERVRRLREKETPRG